MLDWFEMGAKQMPQWLVEANTLLTIPLTVLGFGIAFWQIAKTKSAATAAETAARETSDSMSDSYLLVLLPQLTRVESELDVAVHQNDGRMAANHMSQWRWQAGQLRGLLGSEDALSKRLSKAIQTSITLAATAKIDALDASLSLSEVARPVQDAIAAVTGEVGQLSTRKSKGI